MKKCSSATILGGGLIGMHAAENLAKAGLDVTMVEMLPQILSGYFDKRAASMIQGAFSSNGVRILTGNAVTHVAASNNSYVVSLENGLDLSAHLLLIATGVKPNTDFLADSSVDVDQGILVDSRMKTNLENVWAAGDVAQARNFQRTETSLNGILPDAVEQGRIAGTAMAGEIDPQPYRGGIPMNTYSFFGNRAFSAGLTIVSEETGEYQVDLLVSPGRMHYRKMVFQDEHLVGVSTINSELDPGIFSELILRRIDLSDFMEDLVTNPVSTGRFMMSTMWR
jgi:phenylglyoxylate dehydrogenase epsilon subunit